MAFFLIMGGGQEFPLKDLYHLNINWYDHDLIYNFYITSTILIEMVMILFSCNVGYLLATPVKLVLSQGIFRFVKRTLQRCQKIKRFDLFCFLIILISFEYGMLLIGNVFIITIIYIYIYISQFHQEKKLLK